MTNSEMETKHLLERPVLRFRAGATVPEIVDGDGKRVRPFTYGRAVPVYGGPGLWWFTGWYVNGHPEVIGVVGAYDETDARKQIEAMFGDQTTVDFMELTEPGYVPAGTIGGMNQYPEHTVEGERTGARPKKRDRSSVRGSGRHR